MKNSVLHQMFPKMKNFVKYKKLPSDLKQTFPADLTFFDENKNIIQNP